MKQRHPISLLDLLREAGLGTADIFGNPDVMVAGISANAKRTGRNQLFAAVAGTRTDSHMLLGEAVDAGASVLLVERDTKPYPGVTTVRVPSTRRALGPLAHAFHRHPARAMLCCGVTGTNGKTTVTHLVYSILKSAGMRPGLIGTLGSKFNDRVLPTDNTTPGPVELAATLALMDEDRVDSVVMEVSSHSIDQARIAGIPFRAGAFTCIGIDHLDYHLTMENYIACKKSFFTDYVAKTPGSSCIFNVDDTVGGQLAGSYGGHFYDYSIDPTNPAAIRALDVRTSAMGTQFNLCIEGRTAPVRASLVGSYNVSNMLAAAGCAHAMGADIMQVAKGLEAAPQVPGRFEFVDGGQPFGVIVDYAHTPDALERALRTARRLCTGRILVAFGCGGERDKGKRSMMGKVAGDLADFVIVTSDNPRSEDPAAIARQVVEGVLQSSLKSNRYQVLLDRRLAIEAAINLACPGDVVVIAGKGHETYQDVAGKKYPFDDREVAREVLAEIAAHFQQQPATQELERELAR